MANEDVEPGIWLEMALLACERGETAEAERLFEYIERHFDPPVGIRMLISGARSTLCPSRHSPAGRIAVGIGWSSNVNFGPSQTSFLVSATTPLELRLAEHLYPRADGQFVAEAERNYALGAGKLSAFATLRRNFSAQDFDEGLVGVAYRLDETETANGRWSGSATLAQSWLGEKRYAGFQRLEAELRWSAFSLAAYWQAVDYPHAPAFDARQAVLRAGVGLRTGEWRFAARIGGLLDVAVDERRPGGDRSGWLADIQASRPGPWSSSFEFAWRGEVSRSQRAYLPGLFDMRRDRRLAQLEAAWLIPFDTDSAWRLSATFTRAKDDVPFLGFRQTTIVASWIRVFR